jgi:hypothetical protein
MSPYLNQFESPEAMLLMYLADELPAPERAKVEQMLAQDSALRARLADLAAQNESIDGLLSQVDPPIAASRREAAVRSVSRAMTARQLERLTRANASTKNARTRRIHFRRFLIPVAAAAVLVAGIFLWPRTIQMRGPQPVPFEDVEFPDLLALEQKAEPQNDSLGKLEQEFLSLSSNTRTLDTDAWDLTEEQ